MDLLGSILNSMDKPPSVGDKQKKMMKQQKELLAKQQAAEKEKLKKFRLKVEENVNKFLQDPELQKYKFQPMDKIHRSIIHDVAEVAGLTGFSFGEEDVDRHVMLFKKDYITSEEELLAYRKGEEWTEEKAKDILKKKALAKEQNLEGQLEELGKHDSAEPSGQAYKKKYEKLLGRDAGKDAAKATTPNKQFGFVPSENKRDQRSIEQTLADIRAKKRQKCDPSDASAPDD